ncbi:hypothetical protein ANN_07601 [Periplaneta americana]|uniref:Uncharacterized protein n=1 Tax=Periplaneta americana TaxID=6978 RepID=A0ABQ8T0N4_PERAM|nr:hypothetical protein ANN_07601 [Periplaneta americana]
MYQLVPSATGWMDGTAPLTHCHNNTDESIPNLTGSVTSMTSQCSEKGTKLLEGFSKWRLAHYGSEPINFYLKCITIFHKEENESSRGENATHEHIVARSAFL